MENDKLEKEQLIKQREKELKEQREKLRKKKEADDFKRRYFNLYDDVKISYKEDW